MSHKARSPRGATDPCVVRCAGWTALACLNSKAKPSQAGVLSFYASLDVVLRADEEAGSSTLSSHTSRQYGYMALGQNIRQELYLA